MNQPQARGTAGGDVARRILVVVLLVVAVAMVFFALRPRDDPAATKPGPSLATPLWSARRVPQPVVDAVGVEKLGVALAGVGGVDACFAVQDDRGPVVAGSADVPLIPASTQKLLTSTAALARLGPDFRFETRAVAPNEVRNGAIPRLWLVGAGDPSIATPEAEATLANRSLTRRIPVSKLSELADAIVAAGVRRIPGGILGDASRYDRTRYLPEWPDRYRTEREIGPIGALTVNDGFTGPTGAGPAAPDPAQNAAAELARLLVARGVEVGPVDIGTAPEDAKVIAKLTSAPLSEILGGFLDSSDNLTGELLARELAAKAGKPASTPNGVEAIRAALDELGLPTAGLVMVDGSGLARQNRATCALLLATVDLSRQPRFAAVADGLAVAGEDGTLATRLVNTPLKGKLRAKTGSLDGVSGLAGFVDVKRPLRFAVLLNGGFGESVGVVQRERMATAIGAYPDAPPADELVPAP